MITCVVRLQGMEEGTEHFDRTDTLLDNICGKIGEQEFYGAVWRCVLSSPAVRLPAVQLILRRFDRKKTTDDQLFIIGSDVNIMVCSSFTLIGLHYKLLKLYVVPI